jgi:hypothetical protein
VSINSFDSRWGYPHKNEELDIGDATPSAGLPMASALRKPWTLSHLGMFNVQLFRFLP